MTTINLFTLKEIKQLKKQFPEGAVKGRKIGTLGYVLVKPKYKYSIYDTQKAYEVPSMDIVEPTPQQLIDAGIISRKENQ